MRASLVRSGVHAARSCEPLRLFSASQTVLNWNNVPEHEYQVRVGAAIRHLRETLPQFMERGLVDRDDEAVHDSLSPYLGSNALTTYARSAQIYHKRMYFRFGPQLPPLPNAAPNVTPFKPAFSLRGRRVYLMSAQWLRWSLRALFYDAHIQIEQLSLLPCAVSPVAPADAPPGQSMPRDELMMRLRFRGSGRVSGSVQDFVMLFRYRFDRHSGMICEHYVDEMMPIPGSKMWQALPTGLGRGSV